MKQLIYGPDGQPMVELVARPNEVQDVGPGHAAMVAIAETTTIDWPNGMAIRMAPGRYAILLAAELEGMIANAVQTGRGQGATGKPD